MSDERLKYIEQKLNILKWVAGLGWALIVGSFIIGGWVMKLEFDHQECSKALLQHEIAIKNHGTEINLLHVNEARTVTDIAYIKAAVKRIEKKL